MDAPNGNRVLLGKVKHPVILRCWTKTHHSGIDYKKQPLESLYDLDPLYYISKVKSKKQMSLPKENLRDFNVYDNYTEEDWKLIEDSYNKFEKPDRWGDSGNRWCESFKSHKINFREDYLASKK